MLRKSILVAALLAGCGTQEPITQVAMPGAMPPTVLAPSATSPQDAPVQAPLAAEAPIAPATQPATETPAAPAAPTAPQPPVTAAQPVAPAPAARTELTGNTVSLAPNGRAVLAVAGQNGQAEDIKVAGTYRTVAYKADLRHAREQQVAGLKPKRHYKLTQAASQEIGETARFWVMSGDHDVQVTARTAYVGEHCTVVVDQQVGNALDNRAVEMGSAFDAKLYPTDARLFGAPVTNGRDGKITILLSPEVDEHGQGSTLGYFTVLDLFSPSEYPNEQALAHSNDRLMLYVSSAVARRGVPEDYLGTLAHELQHLISATNKAFGRAKGLQEDVWLNEGLSMYAMQANGFGLGSNARVLFNHVQTYLASPGDWSLTDWDQDPNGSAYGAVYLFVTYLAERAGEDVIKQLVTSPEVGLANLDARLAAKGLTFDGLFKDWVQAMLSNGYKSINLEANGLEGVSVHAMDLPGNTSFPVLPYSANYLLLQSRDGGSFSLGLTGAKASSWLVDLPR